MLKTATKETGGARRTKSCSVTGNYVTYHFKPKRKLAGECPEQEHGKPVLSRGSNIIKTFNPEEQKACREGKRNVELQKRTASDNECNNFIITE
jgi:hypothetical protein